MLECSNAIKCPSLHGMITTYKKFQEAFSDEQLLMQFLPETDHFDNIKYLFKTMGDLREAHKPEV